ncbi:MAG: membrane protein insertion efficiency factor YidD [Thermoguttaceae bacterium]|jgi:putative membrane protein insertion efficiency factor
MKSGVMGKLFRVIVALPGRVLIAAVWLYRWTLSPVLGRHCRFEPSCSKYFIGAVRKYGAIRGTWRGIMRICRCHPWNPGGYDPP